MGQVGHLFMYLVLLVLCHSWGVSWKGNGDIRGDSVNGMRNGMDNRGNFLGGIFHSICKCGKKHACFGALQVYTSCTDSFSYTDAFENLSFFCHMYAVFICLLLSFFFHIYKALSRRCLG